MEGISARQQEVRERRRRRRPGVVVVVGAGAMKFGNFYKKIPVCRNKTTDG